MKGTIGMWPCVVLSFSQGFFGSYLSFPAATLKREYEVLAKAFYERWSNNIAYQSFQRFLFLFFF